MWLPQISAVQGKKKRHLTCARRPLLPVNSIPGRPSESCSAAPEISSQSNNEKKKKTTRGENVWNGHQYEHGLRLRSPLSDSKNTEASLGRTFVVNLHQTQPVATRTSSHALTMSSIFINTRSLISCQNPTVSCEFPQRGSIDAAMTRRLNCRDAVAMTQRYKSSF